MALVREFGVGNMRKIERRIDLKQTSDTPRLSGAERRFCIEMGTGTSKNYVYTKNSSEEC